MLQRWLRSTGPNGRPIDHLLARDYAAFEDALQALEQPAASAARRSRDERPPGAGPTMLDLMRELRLRALRDAPLAFGSTYEREAAFERELWEQRVRANAEGRQRVGFVLEPAAGMAVGGIHDDPEVAQLYGMWVAPEARGGGAGRALVDAVIAWAADRGARRLVTQVTEGNEAALRLYERAGFADTGEREPLGHSDGVTIVLERALSVAHGLSGLALVGPLLARPVAGEVREALRARAIDRGAGRP